MLLENQPIQDEKQPLSSEWPSEGDILMMLKNCNDQNRQIIAQQEELIRHLNNELNAKNIKLSESIPISLLAKCAIKLLERNPETGTTAFQQMEDIIATWQEAHGGAGGDIIEQMDSAYKEIRKKEEERQEHEWLMKNQGSQFFDHSTYTDHSQTNENHLHRNNPDANKPYVY